VIKRAVAVLVFVVLAFAIASLLVGGVASLSTRVVHIFRPGPQLAPPGTAVGDGWELFAETEHFRYYVRPGDHIPRWAMDLAEQQLDAASRVLQVSAPSVIHFHKHPSQVDLHETTGSRSTGVVLTSKDGQHRELHSVHGYDPHEVMHALAHETMGEPPAMFDEGLATAFGWDWTPGQQDVHVRAKALLSEGRIVPLSRLLTNWDFRSYKAYPAYTAAGSFVKYLLAEYGPQKLSELFELDRFSQRDEIEQRFVSTYGEGIYLVEESWRTALQSGILTASSRPVGQESTMPLAVIGIVLLAATFLGSVLLIVAGEKTIDAVLRRVRRTLQLIGAPFGFPSRE
jgi:hypothetical protein